jgi:hypothetical protein
MFCVFVGLTAIDVSLCGLAPSVAGNEDVVGCCRLSAQRVAGR